MRDLKFQPLAYQEGRIRVYVDSSVTYDLEKMNRITAAVLEKYGCAGCHSGRTLDFVSLRDFVVNPVTLDIEDVAARPA
ncbi:hypothetical protein [Eleftheria terrae]|uniref:hypothetical protein n=1 Tax=Eleftheria terrae TaxID=1597781 RepID=UPI00263B6243|nr:hypothetical protein [Eleftheria terrae]WKB53077.1 hypothetical protein N7L95_01340 [Eleftheria terrae]